MILIPVIWILFILCRIGFSPAKTYYSGVLSAEQTQVIKGICALEIMIGHIGVATGSKALFVNRKAGILFVGIFFFLSGYGLSYSMKHKKDYLKRFLSAKLIHILLPAYIFYLIFILAESVLLRNPAYIQHAVDFNSFFGETNWYVWEIIGCYLCFYIIFRLFGKNIKIAVFTIFMIAVIFICTAFLLGVSNPWYGSTLCFPLGILYQRREKWWEIILQRKYKTFLLIAAVILTAGIFSFFYLEEGSFAGTLCGRNAAASAFCLLTVLLLYKIRLNSKNAGAAFGKNSYEIFLIHPYVINILSGKIENQAVFAVGVVVLTLAAAFIYRAFIDWIKSLLTGNYKLN